MISLNEVLAIHDILIEQFGGLRVFGTMMV